MPVSALKKIPTGMVTAIVAMLIIYATLWPDPLSGTHIHMFKNADKVIHALMFFALSISLCFDTSKRQRHTIHASEALLYGVIATLCGCIVELLQDAMGMGRSCDILDAGADFIGAMLGSLCWIFFAKLLRSQNL